MKRFLQHPLGIVFGVLISLIFLWLVVRDIDWDQAIHTFRRVDMEILIISMCFVFAGVLLRAERWRLLIARPVAFFSVYWATAIGFFFNYTYPARAGDVIRVASLKQVTGLSLGRLGVSGVMDRLADVMILLCAVIALGGAIPSADHGQSVFLIPVYGFILVVFISFTPIGDIFFRYFDHFLGWGSRNSGWRNGIKKILHRLHSFRAEIVQTHRILALGTVSALVALADYFSIHYLLQAFAWQLHPLAAISVWVFIAIGSALPSAPAAIGVHQFACVMALNLYGISPTDAFAFSVVLQAGGFMTIVVTMLLLFCLRVILRN